MKHFRALFYDIPSVSLGRDHNGQFSLVVTVKAIALQFALLFTDSCRLGQSGVIKRQFNGALHFAVSRVEEYGQTLLLQFRIDVHDTVPVTCIGLAKMDDVAVQDFAILFIPIDDLHNGLLGFLRVVKERTAVTSLHAGTVVLEHQGLVFIQMLAERL